MARSRYIGLAALTALAMDAVRECVSDSANLVADKARAEAPVESGALEGSIQVDGPDVNGTTVTATVSAGGAASAYAIPQHERTDFSHPGKGNAKYIEGPLIESKPAHREAMRRASRMRF